jgi:molecular chaperone GrpE
MEVRVDDQVAGAPAADAPEVAADDGPDAVVAERRPDDGAPTAVDAAPTDAVVASPDAEPSPSAGPPSPAEPSSPARPASPAEPGPSTAEPGPSTADAADEPAGNEHDTPVVADARAPHADGPTVTSTQAVAMPPDLPPPGEVPALAPPRPPGPRDTLPPAPPLPAPPPGPDPVVIGRLDDLGRRLDELTRLGAHQRVLVDELHADNQKLRAGELFQAQAPLLRDLVRLHDDVERLEAAGGDSAPDLALVRQQLLQVLDRAGVRRYEVAAGEPFDGSRHQGVRSVPATDGAADRTVASMVRCGFERDDGRVLRPADVEVHRAAAT